jgi:membrane-associated protease RseP (regulator of RpoE activity)
LNFGGTMNLEIASVLIFLVIVTILVYFDRKNIEFKYGLLIRKTKRGKKLIYRLGKKYKKKLQFLGNLAIIIGIGASVYTLSSLISASYNIFFRPKEVEQSFALVFPTISGVELPGFVVGIPFWYWIVGVFLVLLAHEPMHGLLARAENVKINSFALLLFVVLPGAFVEPDEKQIKKLPVLKKLRIYASGSFGNFILAGFLSVIVFLGLQPAFFRGSVVYGYLNYTEYNRSEPFPAEKVNLTGAIIAIDEKVVEGVKDLSEIMAEKKPNQTILVETTEGKYNLTLVKNPRNETRGYMGIFVADYKILKDEYREDPLKSKILLNVTELLGWILFLNVGIGAANLLPIKPLDGGLMFEEIAKRFLKKRGEKITKVVSIFTLSLVLIALFGPSLVVG